MIDSKTAESSLESDEKGGKVKQKHKINKNEATLSERIVLIFRILIQIFFLSLQKTRKKVGEPQSDRAIVVLWCGQLRRPSMLY